MPDNINSPQSVGDKLKESACKWHCPERQWSPAADRELVCRESYTCSALHRSGPLARACTLFNLEKLCS